MRDDLIAHARAQGALDRKQGDGHTLRKHIAAAQKAGRDVSEYAPPPLPSGFEHLWGWYVEIAEASGSGGFGPARIGWRDIEAWATLHRIRIAPFELECLVAIDRAYLRALLSDEPPVAG